MRTRIQEIDPCQWNLRRLEEILGKFKRKKILVVGDVGVDRYTVGSVERISQEAPVPILRVEHEQLKLGLAANQADNVKVLGGEPLICAVIGKDRGAEDFRKLLKASAISASHLIVDRARRTILKERVVTEQQQIVRVDYESPGEISRETRKRLLASVGARLGQVDAVILGDYGKGLVDSEFTSALFALSAKAGKIVAVDPKFKAPQVYKGASVLTPNTSEAEFMAQIKIRDDESLVACGSAILRASAANYVVITRGKEGMAIFQRGSRQLIQIPTYAREVFDVSGAGDTVIATLALALAVGAGIDEACILANLAAGVEVGKKGTATVTPEEILYAMQFFSEATG